MSMFVLNNARGESVNLNNDNLLSYTPTGLGTIFTNTYNQYENYFKLTKSTSQQGIMTIDILFGDIESRSYESFSEFATFLAYQPLTLVYTTDAGTWYRDARIASLTKTEIGGTTIYATDRLNEQFSLEFINPWYNNKTGEYRSYDTDSNLEIYGKGFFNEIGESNRNYILTSSGEGSTDYSRPVLTGGNVNTTNVNMKYLNDSIQLVYAGDGTKEWYYSPADAWANIADSVLNFDDTYTISVDVKGTVPAAAFRVSNMWSTQTKINNDTWTRISYTFKFPNLSGDNMSKFYIRLNAMNGTDTNATGFTNGMTLSFRHFKLEIGDKATPWITAKEDGVTDKNMLYTYGYMGVKASNSTNKPFADEAQTDITHLED